MTDKPHPAAIDVAGAWYLRDAKGNLVPVGAVKPGDLLIDEAVRAMAEAARALSAQISRFREDAFARVGEIQGLLERFPALLNR